MALKPHLKKQWCIPAHEYARQGTCSIFIFTESLTAWRHVHASLRRTKKDWALHINELLEVFYPQAKRIRLVMDNLNTHAISSLYETFSSEVALRLAKRLEIHRTPKHESWLNIAEIELNVMTLQCLGAEFPTLSDSNPSWMLGSPPETLPPNSLTGSFLLPTLAISSSGFIDSYNWVKTLGLVQLVLCGVALYPTLGILP